MALVTISRIAKGQCHLIISEKYEVDASKLKEGNYILFQLNSIQLRFLTANTPTCKIIYSTLYTLSGFHYPATGVRLL